MKHLTILTINNKNYEAIRPDGMSDAAFKSMVLRNDMTLEKITGFKAAIERGKGLVK